MIRVTLTPTVGMPMSIGIPTSIDDISIEKHIQLVEFELKNMPKTLKEIIREKDDVKRKELGDKLTKKEYLKTIIPYYANVLCILCENLKIEYLLGNKTYKGLDVPTLERWYNGVIALYSNFEHEEDNIVIVQNNGKNEVWYIDGDFMRGATLNEFLCAAEYEERVKLLGKGDWSAVLGIMAILCRPKDEKFDEELIEERVEFFKKQKLSSALKVGFFLLKLSREFAETLTSYSQLEEQLKAITRT